jgi:hypothetical protein
LFGSFPIGLGFHGAEDQGRSGKMYPGFSFRKRMAGKKYPQWNEQSSRLGKKD